MGRQEDLRNWVMVTVDFVSTKPLETYAGFCVMKITNKKDWTNEVARFYEGDPYLDQDTALAYAESIATTVLQSCEIENFWNRIGHSPKKAVRNG